MKNVIAELNAAPTYEEKYTYLYTVLSDLTFDNLLELHKLIPQEVNDTSENIASMTAITKSQIIYLYNER